MALPPINRSLTPTQPIRPAGDTRTAAQRAFFDAALRRTQETAAPAPATPVVAQPRMTSAPIRAAQPTADADQPTDRLPRPGSLVNILV